jgi:hypothetical protein
LQSGKSLNPVNRGSDKENAGLNKLGVVENNLNDVIEKCYISKKTAQERQGDTK